MWRTWWAKIRSKPQTSSSQIKRSSKRSSQPVAVMGISNLTHSHSYHAIGTYLGWLSTVCSRDHGHNTHFKEFGCFMNTYRSVADMKPGHFSTRNTCMVGAWARTKENRCLKAHQCLGFPHGGCNPSPYMSMRRCMVWSIVYHVHETVYGYLMF